jgi:ADP-heptose:LPS heptosyltransferase
MTGQLFAAPIRKIAVFRALQLGDLLCAVPAIRALRRAYPEAEITLLGLPWAESFVRRFHTYFDRFLHFPGCQGLPEQPVDPAALHQFIESMREERFDLLLQMQGDGTIVNELLTNFGARSMAGFHKAGCRMDPRFFLEYPENVHEIIRHQLLMEHLGIAVDDGQLEFPIGTADESELLALQLPVVPWRYVCIHPGSRGAWRQWPPAHFARLGTRCAEMGYDIVLTGTRDETALTREVETAIEGRVYNCAGRTSLGAVGVLIRDAAMLIANCTGVSHMAAATRTPSVIISMDGEPHRWGPLDKSLHRTLDWTKRPSQDDAMDALESLLHNRSLGSQIKTL